MQQQESSAQASTTTMPTVLTAAELQSRVEQNLRFDTLKDAKCKGMECLITKILSHRRLKDTPLYQSFMLQGFLRNVVAKASAPWLCWGGRGACTTMQRAHRISAYSSVGECLSILFPRGEGQTDHH